MKSDEERWRVSQPRPPAHFWHFLTSLPKWHFIHFSSLIVSGLGSNGAASELVEGWWGLLGVGCRGRMEEEGWGLRKTWQLGWKKPKKKTLPAEQALTQRLVGKKKKKRVWSGTAEPPGAETLSSGKPADRWPLVSLKHWVTPIGSEQFFVKNSLYRWLSAKSRSSSVIPFQDFVARNEFNRGGQELTGMIMIFFFFFLYNKNRLTVQMQTGFNARDGRFYRL